MHFRREGPLLLVGAEKLQGICDERLEIACLAAAGPFLGDLDW